MNKLDGEYRKVDKIDEKNVDLTVINSDNALVKPLNYTRNELVVFMKDGDTFGVCVLFKNRFKRELDNFYNMSSDSDIKIQIGGEDLDGTYAILHPAKVRNGLFFNLKYKE